MSFHVVLPDYRVETESEFQTFPTKQKAEDIYQRYVNRNVPCELYLDGELQKEHKPHI